MLIFSLIQYMLLIGRRQIYVCLWLLTWRSTVSPTTQHSSMTGLHYDSTDTSFYIGYFRIGSFETRICFIFFLQLYFFIVYVILISLFNCLINKHLFNCYYVILFFLLHCFLFWQFYILFSIGLPLCYWKIILNNFILNYVYTKVLN